MKIKLLSDMAVVPTRGSEYAAGYDLYACNPSECTIVIPPGETQKIHTGIAIEVPHRFFGAIFARSGLATRNGLRPANCCGVVDEDFRGEIIVALHNDSEEHQMVVHGMRVAQLVIIPYEPVDFEIVDDLEETQRGAGGFGSTGVL